MELDADNPSINSSKSNSMPDWNIYFPVLCKNEYMSYEMMWEYPKIQEAFKKCAKEHLNNQEIRHKLYQQDLSEGESSEIKERKNMTKFEEFENIVAKLRSPEGCPWDREQTHSSLKKPCIEEAAEVICGINILEETGNPDNLKEELGDLLLQVVLHARIAEEEGYFTMDDVIQGIIDKMVRRHPHVFGEAVVSESGEVLTRWDEIKKWEKEGKEWTEAYLPAAFDEAKKLIDKAAERKGFV